MRLAASFVLATAALLSSCGGSGGGTSDSGSSSSSGSTGSGSSTSTSAGSGTDAGTTALSDDGFLGANLPAVADWARSHAYVDLLRQARRFGSAAAPWDGAAVLGADGWPQGDFGVVLFSGQAGVSGVVGTYLGSFTGRATVAPVIGDGVVRNVVYDAAGNTTRFELVVAAPGDQVSLAFTGTGTGIRDLKIIRPGYDLANPPLFTTEFLDHLRRFQVLRFMDWTITNENPAKTWAGRPTPTTTHFLSEQGVPWEHVIALANQVKKDIWINVPFAADDDYVTQLATLLKSSLDPTLRIYVEYSNELWNYSFLQARQNLDQAVADVAADPRSPLAYDGSTDRFEWAKRRVALRLKRISDLFRAVHGDAAMMTIVRPVLAGQSANPTVARSGLDMINAVYGAPVRFFHAIAGAPYFNLGDLQTAEGLSAGQILDRLNSTAANLPVEHQLEANLGLARWYGLRFFAYEGGPDTFGAGSLAAKAAAHMDPGMDTLCRSYLARWYAQGGDLFLWFSAGASDFSSPFGAWSLTPDLARTDAPKILCMDSTRAAGKPAPALRHVIPFTAPGMATASSLPPYADTALRNLAIGDAVDYVVFAPAAGTYQLVLTAAAARTGNTLDIGVNNRSIMSGFALTATDGIASVDNAPVSIALPQGASTIRLRVRDRTSGFALSSVSVR